MTIRRVAPYAVGALLLGGLLSAPAALAGPRHVARPAPAAAAIGHLAYITKAQTVMTTGVAADGGTSGIKRVGPITKPKAKQFVQVFDLVASGDGSWFAWSEKVMRHAKGGARFVRSVLVIRNAVDGHDVQLDTEQDPVGFAHDTLVTSNFVKTERLVLHPSPHLVKVNDQESPLAAYSRGVVDTKPVEGPGQSTTERLRLTTFSGAHTTLHSYVIGPRSARNPDLGWVSGDGKHLVIERGDHTDFGGIGPSSLADEFGLGSAHPRHQLGHYGTAKAAWRMNSASFSGSSDQVWAVWYRATKTGASSVVADSRNGNWHTALSGGIAVAGNLHGDVVLQRGKWVSVVGPAPEFFTEPTAAALLLHGGQREVLGVRGTTFVWIS